MTDFSASILSYANFRTSNRMFNKFYQSECLKIALRKIYAEISFKDRPQKSFFLSFLVLYSTSMSVPRRLQDQGFFQAGPGFVLQKPNLPSCTKCCTGLLLFIKLLTIAIKGGRHSSEGGRHSSVVSSAPTILRSRVRIPSTPSTV